MAQLKDLGRDWSEVFNQEQSAVASRVYALSEASTPT
jgi:hypothetical protein